MGLEETTERVEFAKGRLAILFKGKDKQGKDIVIKAFSGEDLLAKLVNYFFTGAPAAYSWNEDAAWAAHYRRNIVVELSEYWFGDKLRVAKSLGVKWNDEYKAYELYTELINGRNASLHHPFSEQREWELDDLVNNIMKPLQKNLIESGFDGLAWQAGYGNPVALNNFLLENNGKNGNTWVWIDLESGVPALAPLNLVNLVDYYLPKSIKHRRPLFDDVDINKLRGYIKTHKQDLERKIGNGRYSSLYDNIIHLESHQKRWKSVKRADRSITYQLKKERITQKQADWYSKYPYLWYGREIARMSGKATNRLLVDLPLEILNKLALVDYKEVASKVWKFIISQKYRSEISRNYVEKRIDVWEERDKLQYDEANYLHAQLENEETCSYITDFGVHIVIKPVVKSIEYWGLPSLYIMGLIDEKTLGIALVSAGPVSRTLYTSGRLIQSTIKGKEKPWVALGTGLFPMGGNAAYPFQMIYSATEEDGNVAKFILYDIFTRIGEKFPIWGGKDTRTEHFFNHIPDLIARDRKGLNPSQ